MRSLKSFLFITALNLIHLSGSSQTITLHASKDAWLWSHPSAKTVNFGVSNSQNAGLFNVIRVESWQWISGRNDSIRSLIDFNLDTLQHYTSQLQSATLILKHFSNPNFTKQVGQNKFNVHVVTSNWNESTVNWVNKPLYDNSISVSGLKSTSDTQSYSLDVTPLINHYIQNQGKGFYLKLDNEQPFSGVSFASRENTNLNLRPQLVLELGSGMSIDENNFKLNFNNPFQNELLIEHDHNHPIEIQLINSSGAIIIGDSVVKEKRFDTSGLSKGTYILKAGNAKYTLIKSGNF